MRSALAICTLATAVISAPAFAQRPPPASVSAAFTNVFETDMEDGGTVGLSGVTLTGGGNWPVSQTVTLGVQARIDIDNWKFDKPAAFGGQTPWQATNRFSLGVPVGVVLGDGWRMSLSPSVELNGEEGADASEALGYGLTALAMKSFGRDKLLGVGVGVFSNIEKTTAFPFLIVDWKFADDWRVSNPLQVGPSGPAGLMLSYQIAPQWEIGAGAAYRTYRFRLAEDNPVAKNGVGEASYIPVFAQATYRGETGWRFDLYGGAMTGGSLKVMDSQGDNDIAEDDVKTAPTVAVAFTARF